MSTITLEQIQAAVATVPNLTVEQQGAAIAAVIARLDAENAPTTATPAAPKGPKVRQHTWQMSKAERKARYAAQREFFTGPATPAQLRRIGAPEDATMLAFEAAEEFAAIGAKENGKRFHRIIRGA